MSELSRFGVSVEDDLLQSFDKLILQQGYSNRSEALRDLMRDALVKNRLENEKEEVGDVVGSLTLVYDHHASDLKERMDGIQHQYHHLIVSVLHVHINHDDCLEVIVLRGEISEVRSIAESLLSLKGIKHGKLFITLPAGKITDHSHNKTHKHNLKKAKG